MSNTFDKLSVLDSFIEEVNSYLPEIEANLECLTQSPGDMEALEETHRRTHTIGGSASMMDFPGLAHVAHGMEDILGDVLDGLSTLDLPTIGLLQRSLERLHRLVDGIQSGIDENAVVAEDDADYTQYREALEGASQPGMTTVAQSEQAGLPGVVITSPLAPEAATAIPSLDEMLASFLAPATSGDIAWPEEPAAQISSDGQLTQPSMAALSSASPGFSAPTSQPAQPTSAGSEGSRADETGQASALELLAASSRRPVSQDMPPVTQGTSSAALPPISSAAAPATPALPPMTPQPTLPSQEVRPAASIQQAPASFDQGQGPMQQAGASMPVSPWSSSTPGAVLPGTMAHDLSPLPQGKSEGSNSSLLQVYSEMRDEAESLETQAASLKRTLGQLRAAASAIEVQRAEFKGFLDGSKDALDRMEEWAGRAMGLNLRNSPEQVRRYLPLSVMWVANNKLKKVLDMLTQMAGGIEVTDGQIHTTLQQLHASIEACGDAMRHVQGGSAEQLFTHDFGWSPWEMQFPSEADMLRERVTFERRGDPAALRTEIETRLREEIRQEYENRPMTLAARAELEQQIRKEVREEFEARQKLQASLVSGDAQESVQELERRLRDEIEIEVRQEFLSRLTHNAAATPTEQDFSQYEAPFSGPAVPPEAVLSPPPPVSTFSSSAAPSMATDFGEEAAEIFRLEAEEHLQTISMHVAALEHEPTNLDLMQGVRRATHTLKGAAGMMGFRAIADLCHISEDLLDSIMEGSISISPTVLSLILDTAESLDMLINGQRSEAENETAVQLLRVRYVELLGEQATLAKSVDEEIDAEIEEGDVDNAAVASVVGNTQSLMGDTPGGARSDLSVRVPLTKLDELVNLFGELLVNRSILEERLQRLTRLVADTGVSSARLRDVGQKLESRFEAATLPSGRSIQVMPGEGHQSLSTHASSNGGNGAGGNTRVEPSHLAEFDELELDRYTEFHQLARGLSEGISDMATLSSEMEAVIRDCEGVFGRENRLSTTFQDRLMKARLVPLSTMIPRLYRTARAVALKQHKEFEFVLEGQETEVDRTVIEEIAGPLLHIMRNAVNHAIETPEVRMQRGKPSAGQIKLSAAYEGNQVVITVRDDGTGIDPESVRNEAIARGFIRPEQMLSVNEIIELIFRPGFSTSKVLSEESGRGVGLDVVRDSVSRLRGSLEVESLPGQGTAFTMKFPTSLAIQSAMMVKVGEHQFAIPTVMVEAIGRLDNFKSSTLGGRPAIVVQNQLYPLSFLAQLLGLPVSGLNEKAPIVLVHTDRHRVALVVDDIRGKMDVVMKNLGPHLRHVHGVAGGTVLGNGRVVLILELIELLSPMKSPVAPAPPRVEPAALPTPAPVPQPALTSVGVPTDRWNTPAPMVPPAQKQAAAAPRGKHVLVVDDSPSVRRVVGNMLKQHGWEVQLARDGVEALDMITHETPAAVLLDIEMPRMDGYELMATIRAQEQYRTLPLVVLTSRAASKHQQRAQQLGANAYVVKPYQDEELINTLNSLVYGATVQ